MKKLILILLVIAIPFAANAWTISWEFDTSADGYDLYYGLVGEDFTKIEAGNVKAYDLDSMNLTRGVRYEFYIVAYTLDPRNDFGESDHVRWTYPEDPQIIELPQESKVIINIY